MGETHHYQKQISVPNIEVNFKDSTDNKSNTFDGGESPINLMCMSVHL